MLQQEAIYQGVWDRWTRRDLGKTLPRENGPVLSRRKEGLKKLWFVLGCVTQW
jgi:hypothetical protein